MSSMSEPSAITGFPCPQVATNAVGMPATPRSILKPSFSRSVVRYLEVSNSWKPSSPKLKTLSTMTCACFFIESIWPVRSAFMLAAFSGVTRFWAAVVMANSVARARIRIGLSYNGELGDTSAEGLLARRWEPMDADSCRVVSRWAVLAYSPPE